jgi:putative spermidine/putrescine transport system ATP-binding protein
MSNTDNENHKSLPIGIKSLSKSYGDVYALENVSLDIKAGEFITLLGPSGSGKTTLLMTIAGFCSPEQGSIYFGQQEMTMTPPHMRGLGMVFQNYALFPFMSVAENVGYPLRVRGMTDSDQKTKIEAALEMVQLGGYGERRIHQLSGGQKQRVALARAMVFEPKIILMDEPLSALDKKLREHMQIELKALHQKLEATIVYVTHDQREALTMSDRIAVINNGRLVQVDAPKALYDNPNDLFVADFIGESVLLQLENSIKGLTLRGKPLKMTKPQPKGGEPHCLVIRPELLVMSNSKDDSLNDLSGIVSASVYQGESVLVMVDLGENTMISVRLPANKSQSSNIIPDVGKPIYLGLHAEDVITVKGRVE